jgi:hypothetical protein
MSEQTSGRGAADERSGVPETDSDHHGPMSPSSTPGGDASARGASEERSDSPETE